MSLYQTNQPVPSNDPRDLDDNAKIFDQLLNDTVPSVPDRLLVPRKTWWQVEQDALALISPNISALASLTGAADRLAYFTGVGAMALTPLTAVARALLDDTTVAAQRTTLGLGTAAVANVTTGSTDSTAGRVLQTGDFGIAAATVPTIADADAQRNTGAFQISSASATAAGLPLAVGHTILHLSGASGAAGQHQFASPITSVAANKNRVWHRQLFTTWSAWEEFVYAGANSSITSLTGLTTPLSAAQGGTGVNSIANLLTALVAAGAYSKTSILGTVSQSSGVPTGAAFETGGILAGTGKYFKYADGRMTIIKTLAVGTGSTTAKGSIFGSAPVAGGNFPVAFVGDIPVVQNSGTDIVGGGWTAMDVSPTLTTWGSYSTRAHVSQGASGTIYLTAEGRWF